MQEKTELVEVTKSFALDPDTTSFDEGLNTLFGFAVVSTINGKPYFDLHGDHIPVDVIAKSVSETGGFIGADYQHNGEVVGNAAHNMPVFEDFGLIDKGGRTGLYVGIKYDDPNVLEEHKEKGVSGFSIKALLKKMRVTNPTLIQALNTKSADVEQSKAKDYFIVVSMDLHKIAPVNEPAQEPAVIEFQKSRDSDKTTKETEMSTDEVKALKDEVQKANDRVKELEAEMAKMKSPPEVIYKSADGVEVTSDSSDTEIKLAKALKARDLEAQAAKDAPNVDSELAITLLEAGKSELLEAEEKKAKQEKSRSLKSAGLSLVGVERKTANVAGGYDPDEVEEVKKSQGFKTDMEAKHFISHQYTTQKLAQAGKI